MNKRIIVLIIILPILLMIGVYAAAKTTSLIKIIPVTGIYVSEQEAVQYVDYAELSDERFITLSYEVLPVGASNKTVSFKASPQGIVEIDAEGRIRPVGCGRVTVTVTTNDGAYSADIILVVSSDKVIDFFFTDMPDMMEVGREFVPEVAFMPAIGDFSELVWQSDNPSVLSADKFTGTLKALSVGSATVTATYPSPYGDIVKSALINVTADKLLTFSDTEIVTWNDTASFIINKAEEVEFGEVAFLSTGGEYEFVPLSANSAEIIFTLDSAASSAEFSASVFGVTEKVVIQRADPDNVEVWISDKPLYYLKDSGPSMSVKLNPAYDGALSHVVWTASGVNEVAVNPENEFVISPLTSNTGTTVVKAVITVEGYTFTAEAEFTVLECYSSVNFTESTGDTGLAKRVAIADQYYENGTFTSKPYTFKTSLSPADSDKNDRLIWDTSDSLTGVAEQGKLTVIKDGFLTVTAKSYNSVLINSSNPSFKIVESQLTVQCVKGVNVDDYDALIAATEAEKQVVLTKTIGSEQDTQNGLVDVSEFGSVYYESDTTGDATFYTNQGLPVPKIKIALKIKNNLYGNGYTINAHNLTYRLDATGQPTDSAVFKGPLNFVAIPSASVKAQDNIVFAVYDNVIIDNAVLKGCNDVSDLTMLDYVGTTLEIMGDNVTVTNSRISNGRTVVRMFGDDQYADKPVSARIESCILRSAREFVIRLGSNRKITGEYRADMTLQQAYESCSPSINGYDVNDKYNLYENDENFKNDVLQTKLTLKNCTLAECGIFTVGMDSHFAGPALDGMPVNGRVYDYWDGCAATSYGALLKMEGDVRFYDWKDIESIDSSTLIESAENSILKFDMAAIFKGVTSKPGYGKLAVDYNGKAYVHGGIAFFGGGKNYSVADLSEFEGVPFAGYSISLQDTGDSLVALMEIAAGNRPFGFMMYDASVSEFGVGRQIEEYGYIGEDGNSVPGNGAAFNWIPVADPFAV